MPIDGSASNDANWSDEGYPDRLHTANTNFTVDAPTKKNRAYRNDKKAQQFETESVAGIENIFWDSVFGQGPNSDTAESPND